MKRKEVGGVALRGLHNARYPSVVVPGYPSMTLANGAYADADFNAGPLMNDSVLLLLPSEAHRAGFDPAILTETFRLQVFSQELAQVMESNSFKHFVDLKKTFGSADQVKPYTVFDISGNKYRLIAVVNYPLQSVSIECVLTHAQYGEGRWRK